MSKSVGRVSGGIRTSTALALTVVICGLGGLLLAAGLATGFTALERRSTDVAGESGLVRDLDRLHADLQHWALSIDLVFASQQTHVAQGALEQTGRIGELLNRIDAPAIADQKIVIRSMLEAQLALLQQVVEGTPPETLFDASEEVMDLFGDTVDGAIRAVQTDLQDRRGVLRSLRRLLTIIAWVAGVSYLIVVVLTWRWAAAMFSRPLVQLARSAEEALRSGTPFAAVRRGPHEVQQLAASLEAFAGNLETQVEQRTAQLRTMLSELDHRVKNNLATVIALCEQTGRGTSDRESFERAFIGRLRAMASAHELLAGRDGAALQLRQAVDGVLSAWIKDGSKRLQLEGRDVTLPSEAATPICLVLNELATNAAKHGALSNEQGVVHLAWSMGPQTLQLRWTESGGPALEGPPNRR
ncbi:MAG: hypothetical protein MK101_09805, partial [Phycisphaerales bacterium]|nr:hypothetical protein [Phycisphaerales bacterium]